MSCGLALVVVVAVATWTVASPADGCNKALCASDVSKCLLQVRFKEGSVFWDLEFQTGITLPRLVVAEGSLLF